MGLSNLTIINNALRIIKKSYGVEIELSKMPLDDAKAYELTSAWRHNRRISVRISWHEALLRDLKPGEFDDIIAMAALYRPGPMQFIDSLSSENMAKKITYLHPGGKLA